jgi:hypothetical protein
MSVIAMFQQLACKLGTSSVASRKLLPLRLTMSNAVQIEFRIAGHF